MNIYEQLISQGYYVGSSYDIFSQYELTILENKIKSSINLGFDQEGRNGDKLWYYAFWGNAPDNFPKEYSDYQIEYSKLEEYKQVRKKHGVDMPQQQWFKARLDHFLKKEFNTYYNKILNYVQTIYNLSDLEIPHTHITYYSEGDYTQAHRDGYDPNRVCAIIIYIGYTPNYDETYGGNMLLEPMQGINFINPTEYDKFSVSVNPLRPNYVIFDFTKNNCFHAVKQVEKKFNRFAILNFVYKKQ